MINDQIMNKLETQHEVCARQPRGKAELQRMHANMTNMLLKKYPIKHEHDPLDQENKKRVQHAIYEINFMNTHRMKALTSKILVYRTTVPLHHRQLIKTLTATRTKRHVMQ